MTLVWNDDEDAPFASDGSVAIVSHICSWGQAERWHTQGYNMFEATDRYVAFLAEWRSASDRVSAQQILDAFYSSEEKIVRAAGITDKDRDFYRLAMARKYHNWE